MKIDTTTIEGYADMTAEQKLAALEAFEYEDNSAEIERLKNANSKANSEAAEWKRKHNALLDDDAKKKQAEEDAKNAFTAELETVKAENKALIKEIKTSKYTAKYLSLGYDEKLAADSASAMSALSDEEAAKIFSNMEKHNAALEAKIKADLMDNTPKPNGGAGGNVNPVVEQAKNIGKAKAEANKASADVLKHYGI